MGRKRRNLQGISNNAPSSQEQQMLRGGTDSTKVVQRDVFLSNMEQQMFQGDTIQDGETPTMNLTEGEEQMFIEEIVRDTAKRDFRDLFLSNMEQQMFRGDTIQDRDPAVEYETPAMDLTEEELQKKRTDETRHYTELSNESNRQKQQMDKEIEDHRKRENVELLDIIRAKDEEIQKARALAVVHKTSAMDLTEEELQKKITEETRCYKERINESDRQKQQMEKEIEDHKRENVELLEKIRAKEEEIQKARDEEGNLKKRIEELEKECEKLKTSGTRWDEVLRQKGHELREKRQQLKDLQEHNEQLEEELKQQVKRHNKEERKIATLEEAKTKLEEDVIKLEGDKKKLEGYAVKLVVDEKKLEEKAKQLDVDQRKLDGDKEKLEEDVIKLEGDKKKLEENSRKLDDGQKKFRLHTIMADAKPDEPDALCKRKGETLEMDSEQTSAEDSNICEATSKTHYGKAVTSAIDVSGSPASSCIETLVADANGNTTGENCKEIVGNKVRFCESCAAQDIDQNAVNYCPAFGDELMCDSCSKIHSRKKATKSHMLLPISRLDEEELTMICQPCTVRDNKNQASFVCPECNGLCFCSNCASEHRVTSEGHMLMTMEDFKSALENNCSIRYAGVKTKDDYTDQNSLSQQWQRHQQKQDRPGKPTASDIGSDSVTLFWEKPENFEKSDYFQIGYKDLNSGMKWRFYHGEFTESTVILTNLKSDTKFVFRVRVVYDDIEGPYSEESDEIIIASSLASRLVNYAVRVDNGDNVPAMYALPMTEVANARNKEAKTRKFEIGIQPMRSLNEKTIMMIGETGTGKSTLVDGMANYILSVNWDDPFRFSIINLEEEEKQRTKNQALSQTEWITCYTIHPEKGSRLPYSINIIDTPGFGDTRGLERDQEIVTQIRELFSNTGPQGVGLIDALCFLIKAPDARLTPLQSYIFQSIMSLFGKDIKNNICSLITFADGIDPPVFAALLESGLPFGKRFTFNNSGLFAKNIDLDNKSLAPMFWDMGIKGFRNFFQTLDTMSTKSLRMTSDVLYERNRLEVTIQNLEPKLDAGLLKVNQLKVEIKLLEDHRAEIADNKNFEYILPITKHVKKDLPHGRHVTNCTHCNYTCDVNCAIAKDEDKIYCSAMLGGYCKNCPEKCFWKIHANTPYIFYFITVTEKKTYAEMKKKYQEASGKFLTQEQVLEQMGQELEKMIAVIEDMMIVIRDCNARLAEIALRPNPLTMVDHIDLMIVNEKMHKNQDWLNRVKTLQAFRKRALIHNDVESFHREAHTIGISGKGNNLDQKSVFQRIRDVFHW